MAEEPTGQEEEEWHPIHIKATTLEGLSEEDRNEVINAVRREAGWLTETPDPVEADWHPILVEEKPLKEWAHALVEEWRREQDSPYG